MLLLALIVPAAETCNRSDSRSDLLHLSALPLGTPVLSYGAAAHVEYHSSNLLGSGISIAGPLSLAETGQFVDQGTAMLRASLMFADFHNKRRGGVRVGTALPRPIYLTFIGDGSLLSQVHNATLDAMTVATADFTLGPVSSGLTEVAAAASGAEGRLMIAAAAASTAAIGVNNITFGTVGPSSLVWMNTSLTAIAAKAAALGMPPLRVGFVQADALFTIEMCDAAIGIATRLGMVAMGGPTATLSITPTVAEAHAALAPLQAADADVVVGCSYQAMGEAMVVALGALLYAPKALVLTLTDIAGWKGEYVLQPAYWDPSSPVVGEFSNMSSADFIEEYRQRELNSQSPDPARAAGWSGD